MYVHFKNTQLACNHIHAITLLGFSVLLHCLEPTQHPRAQIIIVLHMLCFLPLCFPVLKGARTVSVF